MQICYQIWMFLFQVLKQRGKYDRGHHMPHWYAANLWQVLKKVWHDATDITAPNCPKIWLLVVFIGRHTLCSLVFGYQAKTFLNKSIAFSKNIGLSNIFSNSIEYILPICIFSKFRPFMKLALRSCKVRCVWFWHMIVIQLFLEICYVGTLSHLQYYHTSNTKVLVKIF